MPNMCALFKNECIKVINLKDGSEIITNNSLKFEGHIVGIDWFSPNQIAFLLRKLDSKFVSREFLIDSQNKQLITSSDVNIELTCSNIIDFKILRKQSSIAITYCKGPQFFILVLKESTQSLNENLKESGKIVRNQDTNEIYLHSSQSIKEVVILSKQMRDIYQTKAFQWVFDCNSLNAVEMDQDLNFKWVSLQKEEVGNKSKKRACPYESGQLSQKSKFVNCYLTLQYLIQRTNELLAEQEGQPFKIGSNITVLFNDTTQGRQQFNIKVTFLDVISANTTSIKNIAKEQQEIEIKKSKKADSFIQERLTQSDDMSTCLLKNKLLDQKEDICLDVIGIQDYNLICYVALRHIITNNNNKRKVTFNIKCSLLQQGTALKTTIQSLIKEYQIITLNHNSKSYTALNTIYNLMRRNLLILKDKYTLINEEVNDQMKSLNLHQEFFHVNQMKSFSHKKLESQHLLKSIIEVLIQTSKHDLNAQILSQNCFIIQASSRLIPYLQSTFLKPSFNYQIEGWCKYQFTPNAQYIEDETEYYNKILSETEQGNQHIQKQLRINSVKIEKYKKLEPLPSQRLICRVKKYDVNEIPNIMASSIQLIVEQKEKNIKSLIKETSQNLKVYSVFKPKKKLKQTKLKKEFEQNEVIVTIPDQMKSNIDVIRKMTNKKLIQKKMYELKKLVNE